MSRALLIRQLAIEFMNDPEFKHSRALQDVTEVSRAWIAGKGRHHPIEEVAHRFHEWWLVHYEYCMIHDGQKTNYVEFINKLVGFASA